MANEALPESFALNELQRVEREELESNAVKSLSISEGKSPDLMAETQRLSSKFGYSSDVIERNLEEFRRREKVEGIDIKGLLEDDPNAMAWVADEKNAALVSDDPSMLGRFIRNIRDFPSSVGDSVDTQALIELRYKQMWGGLTPEELAQADELSNKIDSGVRGTGGFLSEGFQAVGKNSLQMARTVGAGIGGGILGRGLGTVIGGATGAVFGGVGAIPGAISGGNIGAAIGGVGGAAYENFRQQSSLVYDDMLKMTDENGKGIDPDVSRGTSIVVGGVNAGLDLIAFNKLAQTIPGVERLEGFLLRGSIDKVIRTPGLRQAMARIGKKYAAGVTYEALTEGAQEITQIIGEGYAQDRSGGHFERSTFTEDAGRVAEATAGGAGMAIFMGGAGSTAASIKEYKNRNAMPPERVMAHVDAINETMRDPNNKLFQRSPEAFHDYVSKVAPDQFFYVNGDAALQQLMAMPMEQRAVILNAMPNLRVELETAASTGSDVSISKADYATYIAPTGLGDMLKPFMKVDPEGKSLHDIQTEQAFTAGNPEAVQAMQNLLRNIPEGERDEEVGGMVQRLIRKSLADAGANEGEIKTASALFAAQARQYYRLFGDKWKDHFLGSLLEFQTEDETGTAVKRGSNFSVLLNDLMKLRSGKSIAGLDEETRAAIEQFGSRIDEAGLTPEEVRGMDSARLVDTLFAPRPAPTIRVGDTDVTLPDITLGQTPEGNLDIQQAPTEEELQRTKDTLNRYVQNAKDEAQKLLQAAYHGSPHTFDKFDLSKIGTGEGGNMFGWGMYFSEQRAVAADYYERLSGNPSVKEIKLGSMRLNAANQFDYSRRASENDVENIRASLAEDLLIDELGLHGVGPDGFHALVLQNIDERIERYKTEWPEGVRAAKLLRKMLEKPSSVSIKFDKNEGNIYEIDIPDEAVAKMLDWDAPIQSQGDVGEIVKNLLETTSAEAFKPSETDQLLADLQDRVIEGSGMDAYHSLSKALGSHKAASVALSKAGVPGIKYFDQRSREKKEGTRNFVVFDQKLLDKINENVLKLYQGDGAERGSFTPRNAEDFMERMRHVVISMTKDKNMSTLAHEFSHYAVASHRAFSQLAREMQLQGDGRKELQTFIDDWDALKNAVGAKSDKFTVEQEEQVARWFEGYLREGKAPSDRLRPIFARFRSWLVSLYRDITSYMGLEMPKEVEDAFNRWLASEDEIETAAGRNASIMQIVQQFNIDGLQDKITQHLADAIQIAEDRQYKKHLREDRKRETLAYKNEYASIRKDVYAEKIKEPVYATLNWMKTSGVRFATEYVTKRARGFNKKPPAWASFDPITSRHWAVVEDIKDLRDPRRVKKPKVRSLLEFIVSKGGIQDISDEIQHLGGDAVKGLINKRGTSTAKTNRAGGIFGKQETTSNKKNGYSYDRMMEAVAEEGYFNRDVFGGNKNLDFNDLIELVGQELNGSPVYRAEDMNEVHEYETRTKRLEEFEKILSENGLDASRDSNTTILKRLEEIGLIDPGFEFAGPEGVDTGYEQDFEVPDNLPKADPDIRKNITDDIVADDGVSPDMVAERFGFDSGEALLKAIERAPNFEYAVDAEARRRLHEKYPNMIDDGRIRVEAIESLYNDKTLVALDTLISEIGKTTGRTENAGLRQFARALSQRQVELTKMGDANKTYRFEVARERELKAALQASRDGNPERAMLHLQRAMIAQLVFKRLEAFKNVREKALALFSKVDQKDKELAPSRDMDFIGAARFILYKFGLGGEDFQFQSWLEDLRSRDDNLIEDIAQAASLMSDSVRPKNPKEMTVSEFVEVYNSIKNLYRVARQAKEIEKEGKRIKIKTIVSEMIDRMGGPSSEANPSTSFTRTDRIMQGVHSVRSALRRVEQWCGAMDGGFDGPFTSYIWRPISKAQGAFEQANDEWQRRFAGVLKKYASSFATPGKIETQLVKHDELGRPTKLVFNDRNALIGFMLHLGNESNMDKLLGGYGIDPDVVWDEIARLEKNGVITDGDWKLCQELWDMMEEIKPQVQEAHRSLYGYRFVEIDPTPIIRNGKTYRGGYWPAVVQRGFSTNINMLADVYENPAAYVIASTGRGFTKERSKGYREALMTDVRLGSSHLEQVNRFIHIEPAIREVSRVVNDADFKAVLNTHDSSAHGDMLMPWLRRVGRQEMEVIDKSAAFNRLVQSVARFARSSMSAQYIAYNVKVAAQDVANLSVVVHHVGITRFAGAFINILSSKDAMMDIRSMSPMMENRFNQKGEKAQMIINQIVEGRGYYGKMKDFMRLHGNLFIQVVDGYLASASWQAAFNKGVEEGMDDAGAAQYADRVVRDAFGSMTPSDVSAFEANHPIMRVLFPFMSYFIAQSNVAQTEMGNIMREYGWAGTPRLFMAYASIIMAPAIIGQAVVDVLSGRLPDGGEDGDEGWLAWFTESQLSYILGMVPFGNLVGSGIKYLYKKPNDLRASFNPLASIGSSAGRTIYNSAKLAEGEDIDEGKYLKDLLTTIGFATGLPLGQVAKPISYAVKVANDEQQPEGPYDVLVGTVSGSQPKR